VGCWGFSQNKSLVLPCGSLAASENFTLTPSGDMVHEVRAPEPHEGHSSLGAGCPPDGRLTIPRTNNHRSIPSQATRQCVFASRTGWPSTNCFPLYLGPCCGTTYNQVWFSLALNATGSASAIGEAWTGGKLTAQDAALTPGTPVMACAPSYRTATYPYMTPLQQLEFV
jgi:hypothetical protein